MLRGSRFLVATSGQELAELASASLPREKILMWRNGVEVPAGIPERGEFRAARDISPEASPFSRTPIAEESPDLMLRSFAMLPASLARSSRLAFVGPDERGMKTRLAQRAEELGVRSRVRTAVRAGQVGCLSRRRCLRAAVTERKLPQCGGGGGSGRNSG
jgi:hypothetical protein